MMWVPPRSLVFPCYPMKEPALMICGIALDLMTLIINLDHVDRYYTVLSSLKPFIFVTLTLAKIQ